jgi:hypothetical protein
VNIHCRQAQMQYSSLALRLDFAPDQRRVCATPLESRPTTDLLCQPATPMLPAPPERLPRRPSAYRG